MPGGGESRKVAGTRGQGKDKAVAIDLSNADTGSMGEKEKATHKNHSINQKLAEVVAK